MSSIRTVNLAWERKSRGSYAVSRFAVDDEGSVTLVLPRPLVARAYDLTRLQKDGSAEVRATFSVETLLEVEVSAESDAVIGMTSDDLYLLERGAKTRFIPERRIILVDSALCRTGKTVVAGFSDVAGSSYALAVGDISGRVGGLREADAALTAVAISPEGGFVCQADETGAVRLLTSTRREIWLFEQEEPIRCLACSPDGRHTAYGTSQGGIGVIDSEGSRLWDTRLQGDVVSLAISSDGGFCAVLSGSTDPDGGTHLAVLDKAGQIAWEHESEETLTGIALSPSGQYLATSTRTGSHTLYEIIFGQPGSTDYDVSQLELVLRLTERVPIDFDPVHAVGVLRAAIDARPSEVEACERLIELQRHETGVLLNKARECLCSGEFPEAVTALELLRSIAPDEPELYRLLGQARQEWSDKEIERAEVHLSSSEFDAAETILRGVLGFAPHCLDARRRLAGLAARRAALADAEAVRLLAESDIESGLAALERAQQIASSADRAEKIRSTQCALEFAAGMRAYDEKRYREAVFQFKKVLARDPSHVEARKQLNYAQRFEQDSNEALNDRFGRLE